MLRAFETAKKQLIFFRESKYEIKGSKSRRVREKNVIYRITAIRVNHAINGKKMSPQNSIKHVTAERPNDR